MTWPLLAALSVIVGLHLERPVGPKYRDVSRVTFRAHEVVSDRHRAASAVGWGADTTTGAPRPVRQADSGRGGTARGDEPQLEVEPRAGGAGGRVWPGQPRARVPRWPLRQSKQADQLDEHVEDVSLSDPAPFGARPAVAPGRLEQAMVTSRYAGRCCCTRSSIGWARRGCSPAVHTRSATFWRSGAADRKWCRGQANGTTGWAWRSCRAETGEAPVRRRVRG